MVREHHDECQDGQDHSDRADGAGDSATATATSAGAAAATASPEKSPEPLPKDVPDPTPEQQPDQAPDQPLGVDAEGSAGGDAFGLAARSGGSDLIGGTGTAPFAWYTNRMRDTIKDRLSAAPCTKSAKGSLTTRIVLGADGRVKQIKLTTSTGNPQLDSCVEKVLDSITTMGDAPPATMPESVSLRLVF